MLKKQIQKAVFNSKTSNYLVDVCINYVKNEKVGDLSFYVRDFSDGSVAITTVCDSKEMNNLLLKDKIYNGVVVKKGGASFKAAFAEKGIMEGFMNSIKDFTFAREVEA